MQGKKPYKKKTAGNSKPVAAPKKSSRPSFPEKKQAAVSGSGDDSLSLNKYISNTGFCSRREADQYIEQARVTINDKVAVKGNRVYPGDIVAIDGEGLTKKNKTIYIAFNKPVGITCTTDTREKDNIISFIGHPQRIFPIGRLDKDSEGLIFLTNDGDIVNKILRAGNHHEKEYLVQVNQAITPEFIKGMRAGVPILGTRTLPCFVQQEGRNLFRIKLVQGLNRQIRRMCHYFGYEVVRLQRVRIMNISLGKLPVGHWRLITQEEIRMIQQLVSASVKTQEASAARQKRKPQS